MKITIYFETDSDDFVREELFIDGKDRKYVGPLCECPEDAIIGRSLVSCTNIANFMREAYAAGKLGEELTVEYLPMED